ncbi:MAG: hypothetical protein PF904_08395 [Kiritimatiellae bacterium]|jgi:hypothetical protein|nr:hypothetical protein [Kiritimatiellia bacterium]
MACSYFRHFDAGSLDSCELTDQRAARGGQGAAFDFEKDYFEAMCQAPVERAKIAWALLNYSGQLDEDDLSRQMVEYHEETLKSYINAVNQDSKLNPDCDPESTA